MIACMKNNPLICLLIVRCSSKQLLSTVEVVLQEEKILVKSVVKLASGAIVTE